MISNKSKSIILLAGIMLSSAAFTIGTNNNNYEKNTAVYSMNTKADESEALKTTDLAKVENTTLEVIEKEEITTEKINIIEENTSNDSYMANESVVESNSETNTSYINKDVVDSSNEKEENSEISEIENKDDIELETDKNENNSIDSSINTDSDINNDNIIAEETPSNEEDNIDIAGVENTIPCPPLSEAPTFTVSEGINANGIGDSVYNHLKEIGWTTVDENTIKINDDRLQFKNMNGQGGVDSIITMTCDFEENDKYYLYLLKLMIGDKSVSTANPTESEIFSGAFDDTYYDNFENLVRRIANGSGMIKYSNRNIRVQYDGKWDYTITLTFYNYSDNNNIDTPTIGGDINIVY